MTRLKWERLKLGWSQAELARKAGVSEFSVSRLENGVHRPRELTLMRLGEALGVPSYRRLRLLEPVPEADPSQRDHDDA